ncbi:tryptophan-rich sensory protein [Mechercharimyces sp. CAU 1602]|uniref:tryptophan-rich sensory protein n=1 Tax=Mechercharimyces sp. CAU 1602 TaxID=2973933 RepID=UPI002163C781|nr:tryptophan-rich sensory protein [Mechercharimyces sp. CAU 1602]MCS1350933.1 tryptophan-rich sensory protein [Mechercharimyces sp. CAU 1602]
MQTQLLLRISNVIALLAVVSVNFLANWLPINGKTTGELSSQYPVLITPAPYVFSIWGLIYLLLAAFVLYLLFLPVSDTKTVQTVGWWFVISSILNISWIFLWHYEQIGLSVLVMLMLLLTLIVLYRRIQTNIVVDATIGEQLFVRLPFSIYLAWICVATIVNISVYLYASGWDRWGLSEEAWTICMMVIGTVLAMIVSRRHRDYAFALVFVWAWIGIAIKQINDPVLISATGYILSFVLFLWVYLLIRQQRQT